MISPLVLERPGGWRIIAIVAVAALLIMPAGGLLALAAPVPALSGFGEPLAIGLAVAGGAGLLGLLIGLPAGVLAALCEAPARRLLLALTAVPLIVPTFLRAIGLSMLAAAAELDLHGSTAPLAAVLAFTGLAIPLVLLTAFAATRVLSRDQLDAQRLARGDGGALWQAMRAAAPVASAAAVLGAILTLADPGPPLLFGYPAPASEILTSLAALYDFPLAGRQSLVLSGIVVLLVLPFALSVLSSLTSTVLARDMGGSIPGRIGRASAFAFLALVGVLAITLWLPLAGLTLPLAREMPFERAWEEIARSLPITLLYATGSALVATFLAIILAFAAGRSRYLCRAVLVLLVFGLSLPPALSALGAVQLSTTAPAAFDPVVRGSLAVAIVLGLRFVPVATVVLMRGLAQISASSTYAAAIHGLRLPRYVRAVLAPQLLRWLVLAMVLVALLATAEVSIVLLLRPPDADSVPVAIFAIMANAPEALVALMCWLYILATAAVLMLAVYGRPAARRLRLIAHARV